MKQTNFFTFFFTFHGIFMLNRKIFTLSRAVLAAKVPLFALLFNGLFTDYIFHRTAVTVCFFGVESYIWISNT